MRQDVRFRNKSVRQNNFAGDRGAQGKFSLDLWRGKTGYASFHDKAPDHAIELRPYNGQIADGRIGDPGFGAVEAEVCPFFRRSGPHAAWIRTGIGLGEAEAS